MEEFNNKSNRCKHFCLLLLAVFGYHCTTAHDYGSPTISIKKCLESHRPHRNRSEGESFVKFDLLSSAGFGNRLFVYLAARAISYRFNKTLLHIRHFDSAVLRALNFDPACEEYFEDEVNTGELSFEPYHNDWTDYNNQTIDISTSYHVGGYMQTHKFADFPKVREKIWKGLQFPSGAIKKSADECMKIYKFRDSSGGKGSRVSGSRVSGSSNSSSGSGSKSTSTSTSNSNSSTSLSRAVPVVCIHIRLGDKFEDYRNEDESINYNTQNSYSHWVPNADFIRAGLKWFDATLSKAKYLVFSDTMSRVRAWKIQQYTPNKVTFLPDLKCMQSSDDANTNNNMKNAPPHALIEMSIFFDHCDHLLLTAGTFPYWAGWKSTGHVLQSKLQFVSFASNKSFWSKADEEDYFPPNCRLVEPCEGQLDRFCNVSEARDPLWNQRKMKLVSHKVF